MSSDEAEVRASKRKAESEDEEDQQEPCKRERLSPELESEINRGRLNIDEAIKALDRVQYELNMGNIPFESPESSDHDTPPESEDESDEMLSQAHALGFAACIRETFRFLDSCGISENDPIYEQLKSRFVGLSN
jgi:hypothetical protein